MPHRKPHIFISRNRADDRDAGVVLDSGYCLFSVSYASDLVEDHAPDINLRIKCPVAHDHRGCASCDAPRID